MGGTPAESRPSLAAEVLEAYGGERWAASSRLMVIFSAGGPRLAGRLQAQAVRCRTAFLPSSRSPDVLLDAFPEEGRTGMLDRGEARVLASDGTVAASGDVSTHPSSVRWGDLDVLVFAGTTLWSWVALPLLLGEPGLAVRELPPEAGDEGLRRLEVEVPSGWPVTSRRHVLHVDGEGRVRRHDEDLTLLGRRRAVRSELSGHCDFEGVLVATHRRTRWLGAGLLWADVVAAHLIPERPKDPSTDP